MTGSSIAPQPLDRRLADKAHVTFRDVTCQDKHALKSFIDKVFRDGCKAYINASYRWEGVVRSRCRQPSLVHPGEDKGGEDKGTSLNAIKLAAPDSFTLLLQTPTIRVYRHLKAGGLCRQIGFFGSGRVESVSDEFRGNCGFGGTCEEFRKRIPHCDIVISQAAPVASGLPVCRVRGRRPEQAAASGGVWLCLTPSCRW
jgi:hypothetical protein